MPPHGALILDPALLQFQRLKVTVLQVGSNFPSFVPVLLRLARLLVKLRERRFGIPMGFTEILQWFHNNFVAVISMFRAHFRPDGFDCLEFVSLLKLLTINDL